ncbi:MAG TPA: TetR/AcrR family transcriptional regulator [Solirubrobacteraceae bacterium]
MAAEHRFQPLPAGSHGLDPGEVRTDQGRRLREAMIELIAEKGFPAVRISDLSRLAHVSPPTLYSLYADKEHLLLGTYEDVARRASNAILGAHGEHEEHGDRLRGALEAFAALASREPKAISLLVLGAFGAGPAVLRKRRAALDALEAYIHSNRSPGEPLDQGDLTVRAMLGGVREITAMRLRNGRERELPELAEPLRAWAGCYPPCLPAGLRAPDLSAAAQPEGAPSDGDETALSERARRAEGRLPSGRHDLPREAIAKNQQERIVDATAEIVSEQGLGALTIPAIAKRANVSNQTFYSFYASKHDAFLGTQKVGMHQALGVTAEAYGAHPEDWPRAVAAGLGALLGYLASEPAHAHLTVVDTFAASPETIAIREDANAAFSSYLAPGFKLAAARGGGPTAAGEPPGELAAEAVVGGIWQVLHDYVARGAAAALPGAAPQLSYFALAPFIGAEDAAAAALAR